MVHTSFPTSPEHKTKVSQSEKRATFFSPQKEGHGKNIVEIMTYLGMKISDLTGSILSDVGESF